MTEPFSSYAIIICRSWAWHPAWPVPATWDHRRICWYSRLHSDPTAAHITTPINTGVL